jgi:hypothetical protein
MYPSRTFPSFQTAATFDAVLVNLFVILGLAQQALVYVAKAWLPFVVFFFLVLVGVPLPSYGTIYWSPVCAAERTYLKHFPRGKRRPKFWVVVKVYHFNLTTKIKFISYSACIS